MGGERNAGDGLGPEMDAAPRPRKRKKHHGDVVEKPIQLQAYSQKPDTTHVAALRYLEECIRQSGTWGEIVTGCHWKVGH